MLTVDRIADLAPCALDPWHLAFARAVEREATAGLRERAERAEAERDFLHKRRGELVIERDRYKAALAEYPEGRDVFLAGALAEVEALRAENERLRDELRECVAVLMKICIVRTEQLHAEHYYDEMDGVCMKAKRTLDRARDALAGRKS